MSNTIHRIEQSMDHLQVDPNYCMKTPTLCAVLSGSTNAPWDLSALKQYAVTQFCPEVLDFYMDAYLYRLGYETYKDLPSCKQTEDEIHDKWARIMALYIQSNAVREINIPGNMRRCLLAADAAAVDLKSPDLLMPAFNHMHEILREIFLQWASTISSVEHVFEIGACNITSMSVNSNSTTSSDDELSDVSKSYKSVHDLWGYRVYRKIRAVSRKHSSEDENSLTRKRWG